MYTKFTKYFSILAFFIGFMALPMFAYADTPESSEQQNNQRIVSVGGGLTEILYELGVEKQIVGVDTTSKWPKAAMKKPQVGYQRKLSAEGILSLQPSVLLVTEDAGPQEVLQQIRGAGVPVTVFKTKQNVEGVIENIKAVAKTVGKVEAGEVLATKINNDYAKLKKFLQTLKSKPSTAFFLGMGKGSPMVAGKNTGADSMIELAGGKNAFANIESYKQISAESMIAAAPEVILIASHAARGKQLSEIQQLKSIKLTPAAKNNRVIVVDTMLMLGFGPRIVEAIDTLARQIHNIESKN